jgi:hypothetical protein
VELKLFWGHAEIDICTLRHVKCPTFPRTPRRFQLFGSAERTFFDEFRNISSCDIKLRSGISFAPHRRSTVTHTRSPHTQTQHARDNFSSSNRYSNVGRKFFGRVKLTRMEIKIIIQ